MDLVVGDRDRLAHAVLDLARSRARAASRSIAQRGLGRLLAGRLAAHAVDDDEEAADGIVVKAILVDRAQQPRMGVSGRPQGVLTCMRELSAIGAVRGRGARASTAAAATIAPSRTNRVQRSHVMAGPGSRNRGRRCRRGRSAIRSAAASRRRSPASCRPRRRTPSAARRPFTVVPSVLRSTMKNVPLWASRRMRACSRETSIGGVDPHVDAVRDAAASDRHRIAHDVEGVRRRRCPS